MKWFWNKEEKDESDIRGTLEYDAIQKELADLKAKMSDMEKEAKRKEHDSHIVDYLNTYEYGTKSNVNIRINKLDSEMVEIIQHNIRYYAFYKADPDIKIRLSKDEAYLLGEFLHENNN